MRSSPILALTTLALLGSCATAPAAGPPSPDALGPAASPPSQAAEKSAEQAEGQPAAEAQAELKQANNPLANMRALNFHDYYVPDLSGTDETANLFYLRYAQPFQVGTTSWLMRATLPVNRFPVGMQSSESGLGDANVFAAYLFDTPNPAVSFGLGPIVGLPTATDDALGTDQWSAGAAMVVFDARSDLVQYGSLVTYQHKIAGSDSDPDVNLLALQPFGMLQLGGGSYFRSTGIWTFDLESGNYAVPLGFGLGRVVKAPGVVLNFFLEPQVTLLEEGPGQPEFQVFFGFNTQFLGG